MTATLQSIFQTSFEAYASERSLPLKHHQAARAIMNCRTPAQGGHEQRCPDGHESHIQYHSCRHRSCPKCNALPKAQWVQQQFNRLLPVNHYHVIFTLPHELLSLWRYNQAWFSDALFRAVSETLLTLFKDKKHAVPGLILSLHTWGRNLVLHPHIHCLVTGGGLSPEHDWVEVNNGYLLPSRIVRTLYQGKMLSFLWEGLRSGELKIPPSEKDHATRKRFKALGRKKWNVRIQPPYAHGKGVMKYLANYVKGGPISNHRIERATRDHVSFVYRDHRDAQHKSQRLSAQDFMSRILVHVAEPRRHVVRHYGLYAHQARGKRNVCRKQLGCAEEAEVEPISWEAFIAQFKHKSSVVCGECGKRLVQGVSFGKNSIYKVKWHGHVQQPVRADTLTWLSEKDKPPEAVQYFFSGSVPLN